MHAEVASTNSKPIGQFLQITPMVLINPENLDWLIGPDIGPWS
jgi:hypothetical protein